MEGYRYMRERERDAMRYLGLRDLSGGGGRWALWNGVGFAR